MTYKKKALFGAVLTIALFTVLVIPTQAGTTTLASLAAQVSKIVKQVKNLTTGGTLPSKYVTYKDSKKVLPGDSVGAALDNIAKGKLPASAIAYTGTTAGLQGKNVQAAIDEIGVSLKKLVNGAKVTATGVHAAATGPTNWNATTWSVCSNTLQSATATVTFTPSTTDDTTGTWASVGYNIFNPGASGSGICFGTTKLNYTFTGNYKIVEDMILTWGVSASGGDAITVGYTATARPRGNNIIITDTRNSPQLMSILTPQ